MLSKSFKGKMVTGERYDLTTYQYNFSNDDIVMSLVLKVL